MRLFNLTKTYPKALQINPNMTTIKGRPVNIEIIKKNIHPLSFDSPKDYDKLMEDIGR